MMKYLILLLLTVSLSGYAQVTESAESHFEEAIRLQNADRHGDALSQFNKCLFLKPGFAEAYAARASSRERLNDLQGALTDLNTCLQLRPDHYETLLSRGSLLFRVGRYGDAKADFQKMLTLPKGVTTTIYFRESVYTDGTDRIMTAQSSSRSLAFNYLGLCEVQLGNSRQGVVYLDSAISIDPTDADFYVNRALAKKASNDQTAVADFQKALSINPDHAIAKHNLALQSAATGSVDENEKKFTEAIESDSTLYFPYVDRGYYRFMSGNFTGALSDYNQALLLNNLDPQVWLSRGLVNEKLQNLEDAYADYTHAINLKEDMTKAWLNRGNIFMKQERYQDAVDDYTSAITYEPEYGHAYFNRAIAWYKMRRHKEACDDLMKAEQLGVTVEMKMRKSICK